MISRKRPKIVVKVGYSESLMQLRGDTRRSLTPKRSEGDEEILTPALVILISFEGRRPNSAAEVQHNEENDGLKIWIEVWRNWPKDEERPKTGSLDVVNYV
jgi:hypothetical protein